MFFQVQAARKMNRLNSYACENGAKEAIGQVVSWADEFSGGEIEEKVFQELKTFLTSGNEKQLVLLDSVLNSLEIAQTDEFSRLAWETLPAAKLTRLDDYGPYLKTTYELMIEATGKVQGFRWEKAEQVNLEITFFLGKLPLNRLPFSVYLDGLKKEDESNIKITRLGPNNLKRDKIIITEIPIIPDDALPLLARGLKLFRPDGLPNWLLRQALGLTPGNEKVPDGVYLVKDDLGPGGLYVQGNVDELLLGLDGNFQLIQFRQEDRRWLVRFSPDRYGLEFFTPEGKEELEQSLLPIIMVNGRIDSLAGGEKKISGWLEPNENSDQPVYLRGIQLTLVCSGKINITSNLLAEGLKFQDGVPYLREKQSQLIIWSTAKDFQTQESVDGGIILAGQKPDVLKVAANLIAAGEGLKINGLAAETEIIGTLTARAVDLGKRKLSLFVPEPVLDELSSELSVYSAENLLYLDKIKMKKWGDIR
ncbi:MAG: hypothetical protein H5U07_10490 [Candidatus Aminicenantes bacterium]|nr:hypothetical protein [Candidatus Aminicenantes bacterium]